MKQRDKREKCREGTKREKKRERVKSQGRGRITEKVGS